MKAVKPGRDILLDINADIDNALKNQDVCQI